MSNKKTTPLFPTNEIVGSILVPHASNEELKDLQNNTKDTLMSKANLEVEGDVKINIVENTENDVNIALPYYAQVGEISARCLKDAEVKNISGGEIVFTIAFAIGVGLGTIGAAVAATVAPTVIIGATAAIAIGAGTVAASVGTAVTAATVIGVGIDQGVKASKGK